MIFMVLSFYVTIAKAQHDSINYHHRKVVLWTTSGVAYTAGMMGLYQVWYKDYPQSSFHFFNDNSEWQMQDKLGHIGSAYYISNWTGQLYQYAGYDQKKAALLGALTGFGFQFTIEMFDGYSSQWGFSPGDLAANTIGSSMYYLQAVAWNEQRIKYKISYHATEFPKYNPSLLGDDKIQRVFKDYNGQTLWISFNLKDLIFQHKQFPSWLNMAVGYNASGMTGANTNRLTYNGNAIPQFERVHYFILSPDIDITKIKSRYKAFNVLKETFGFLKFPMPAIRLKNNGKINGEVLYF
jgi:hypothetical protein